MPENKKKTSGEDNASTSKSSSKSSSKIFERVNKMWGLLNQIKEDAGAVDDFAKVIENSKKLAEDLKAKESEVQGLQQERDVVVVEKNLMWKEFAEQQLEYSNQLKAADERNRNVDRLQVELEDARQEAKRLGAENKTLTSDLAKNKSTLQKCRESLKITQAQRTDLELRYSMADNELTTLQDLLGEGQLEEFDMDALAESLTAFAARCHKTVLGCFQGLNVPPASLPSPTGDIERLPLSLSMSTSAKLMRCALAEFVLSKALVDHIFTDIYFPGHVGRQETLSTILGELEELDPRRGAAARCQLLLVFEAGEEQHSMAVEFAKEDIFKVLRPFLPVGPIRDEFEQNIEAILKEAIAIWESMQRSKNRITAELSVDSEYLERDDCYPEYGELTVPPNTISPGHSDVKDTALVPLRPQFSTNRDILLPTVALWRPQEATVNAIVELELESSRKRSPGQTSGLRRQVAKRRQSIDYAARPASATGLPSLPATPSVGNKQNVARTNMAASQLPATHAKSGPASQ
ncbi:hypothetical protein B0T26DRAFT_427898 [Lasiosphaeria miniovina]|uniref:Uncharacterized protein n=1 Tax=Lasiosphaeria miniovina TaxID=1954250 RepID=A0AA40DNN9_9PEZI|nr:uncharacterized protein B0T26DRAFT_427898 [Lasiosphaeria miniovina]KAK0709880.1 hypothetical protein B0T26DRAFT_427898 [Lasiosphaeria miniovina]